MRRIAHRTSILALPVVLLGFVPAPARGSAITPLVDAPDPRCAEGVPSSFTFRIEAELFGDPGSAGIRSARFRVTGLEGFLMLWSPNPVSSAVTGSPSTGIEIAFPSCQTGGSVVLFHASVLGYDGSPRMLRVLPADGETCALVSLCDSSPLCVADGFACVNNPGCCVTLGVEPASWSAIRLLYD